MNTLTRRSFGRKILAAGAVTIVQPHGLLSNTPDPEPPVSVPDSIAGYTLTSEEKQLAEKFLMNHEKNMKSLRESDLPNSLSPDFIFASPKAQGENGAFKK